MGKLIRRAGMMALLFVVGQAAAQQAGRQLEQASYQSAQAERGAALYQQHCAASHLPDLQGFFEAVALRGGAFVANWRNHTPGQMLDLLVRTMPTQAPGSLGEDEYLDITAFLLQAIGIAADGVALTADSRAVLFVGTGGGIAAAPPQAPTPGLAGTVPSPESRNSIPEIATMFRSDSAATRMWRQAGEFRDIDAADLAEAPAEDWLWWRGALQSQGFSSLAQINTDNAHRLALAWVWSMEPGRSQPAPLVRNGIVFVPNFGNLVQAIDARTGAERWDVEIADAELGYSNTSGPIVADGKIVNGITGCGRFFEDSCFITGHDAETDEELWRTYTIARPGEPGGDSWGDLPLESRGGGDVWLTGSWDPRLGLVFFGTAQVKPWMAMSRGLTTEDAALYTNSTLAIDPDDGRIVWHRQHVPDESLDMDESFGQVLADLFDEPYLLTIGKSGILWKLDRRTGEFLGLRQTVFENVFSEVNLETGQVRYRDDIRNMRVGEWLSVCPSTAGGHNWQASACHPPTGQLAIPLSQSCMEISPREVAFEIGGGGTQADRMWLEMPGTEGRFGKLAAHDVANLREGGSPWRIGNFLAPELRSPDGHNALYIFTLAEP